MDIFSIGIRSVLGFGGAAIVCIAALRGNPGLLREIAKKPALVNRVLKEEGNLAYIGIRGGNKLELGRGDGGATPVSQQPLQATQQGPPAAPQVRATA